jgi:hypothetical protein
VDPAVHAAARAAVIQQARDTGMKTEKMLDETFYQMMTVYLGR